MSKNKRDLTLQKFGRLTAIEVRSQDKQGRLRWSCVCDCGNVAIVASWNLVCGGTKSCGCLLKEIRGKQSVTHRHTLKGEASAEYRAWKSMKERCYNKNSNSYPGWGGRGIIICERWLNSFENFFADMGRKPTPKHTLDRFPDNNGNYEPSNCRWATEQQQQSNKRNNKWMECNGKKMTQAEWARFFSIKPNNLHSFLKWRSLDDIYKMFEQNKLSKLKQ